MKFLWLHFIFLIVGQSALCQVKSVLIDLNTKAKIPYVNIWLENENVGTTSNENGEFELIANDSNKIIVFSAIGYQTKRIKAGDIKSILELIPNMTVLQEVFIRSKKGNRELKIDSFKKSETNSYFSNGGTPWMVAKFFAWKDDYKATPFLKKINILTDSKVKNASFNIRLYSVNEKGEPGVYLYDKNIIGNARKGKTITEVDLSNLDIQFPENGLFIAYEWLIIESNRNIQTYTNQGSNKKLEEVRYEPKIATFKGDKENNSWNYTKGSWKKWSVRYFLLAMELTLTN